MPAPAGPQATIGRYAPSPTGRLHLGNLRTALLAWLSARQAGGTLLVRMEDLDTGRVRPGIADGQLADLAALGLHHDGEVMYQHGRSAAHEAAIDRLTAAGLTYPCFCTRAEIREAASAAHGPRPEGAYPGTCRRLTRAEVAERIAAGRRPALRLRADGQRAGFVDRRCGPVTAEVDDFVLRRGDGAVAYNLAVVVDDAAQAVTEVVRGDDLLQSTPRQLLLGRLLGLPAPTHMHVPLVLGPDGSRLAKRHGGVTLADVAPGPALTWMARSLGLAGPSERVPDPSVLLGRLDPARLPSGPTVWRPSPG